MSKSCKRLYPGLFLLGAATALLVFAAPQTCAEALRHGLALCGGSLLVSLFPFLVVSALIMRSGAGEVLGVLLWPVVRCIGLRSRSAGSVLLIGLVGGFAPAAAAAAEAVRSRELTPQEASALLPACICSGPSFVILTVGEQLLGSRTAGMCLFAAQVLAGWLTAALLCRVRGIPEPLPAPPTAVQAAPPPALDAILAQAAVTYLKLCGFVLYFRLLAAGCGLLLPAVLAAITPPAPVCGQAGCAVPRSVCRVLRCCCRCAPSARRRSRSNPCCGAGCCICRFRWRCFIWACRRAPWKASIPCAAGWCLCVACRQTVLCWCSRCAASRPARPAA